MQTIELVTNFTTYYHSPVGMLRISGTDHYISEVHFMKEEDGKAAQTNPDALPPLAIQAIEQLIQYFHGDRRTFELPLNQDGTDFQQKVWNELANIPFGRTISYQEFSRRLGDPKVIRAAASANGKNHIAIIIPCHRVIGAKGDLVGFGGGLARKKWLLNHENKVAHGVQTLF